MPIDLTISDHDSWTVVSPVGEIDVAAAPSIRERLIELIADGHNHIVVDLTEVDFLDSTGLGVLVGGVRRTRSAGGDLRICCTNPRILKVFEITGLDEAFTVAPTVEDTIARPATGG